MATPRLQPGRSRRRPRRGVDPRLLHALLLLVAAIAIWRLQATRPPEPVRAKALRYRPVAADRIVAFYHSKDSRLATTDAANAILFAAWRHDVDPVVLVAVTGQEQGFVPTKDDPRVAKNPFNVYGCWCKTTIELPESANVAAATIATRLQCLPRTNGVNLVRWVNALTNPCNAQGTYAEDPRWGRGVARLYAEVAPALGVDASIATWRGS